jgi:hypothetical protein
MNTVATMTERVWVALEKTYQPTQTDFVSEGLTWRTVHVPHGPRRTVAHRLGPKLCFVLLAVARALDREPYPDVVTSEIVAAVTGMAQSGAAKALAELTRFEWLESFTLDETRSLKYYRVIGA